MLDAVIASDWHLGSRLAQVDQIGAFLRCPEVEHARRLVLLGDILERNDPALSIAEQGILARLQHLGRGLQLVWVAGNHDHSAGHWARLIGADFLPCSYAFQSGPLRILCTHGDSYDHWLYRHRLLTWLGDSIYLAVQRISPRLAVALKHGSKATLHISEAVRAGALMDANLSDAHITICGHTHNATQDHRYVNSGCWTEPVCHWVSVERGEVRLREWPEQGG